jgi:hypothetical protein
MDTFFMIIKHAQKINANKIVNYVHLLLNVQFVRKATILILKTKLEIVKLVWPIVKRVQIKIHVIFAVLHIIMSVVLAQVMVYQIAFHMLKNLVFVFLASLVIKLQLVHVINALDVTFVQNNLFVQLHANKVIIHLILHV